MFKYRATDPQGRIVEGVADALSERAVMDELRRRRLYPIAVSSLGEVRTRKKQDAHAVALYARTLASVAGAGIPLERALGFAAEQAASEQVRVAGHAVQDAVTRGDSLAQAIESQPIFGKVFAAMVAAGEQSGALEESLNQVAAHLEEVAALRADVTSALLYPALVGAVSLIAVALLLLFVIPRFGAMLQDEGAQLPLTTRTLVAISTLLVRVWWLIPIVVAAIVMRLRKEPRPRLPLLSRIDDEYAVVLYARTLGMLLRSGRAVLPAMETAAGIVGNAGLRARLDAATARVAEGDTVRGALDGVLPPLATEMLAVGEESGSLDEMCLRVADAFEANIRRSLRAAVALLEPTLIVIMAGVVGFVALAMLQAIYSINRSMF